MPLRVLKAYEFELCTLIVLRLRFNFQGIILTEVHDAYIQVFVNVVVVKLLHSVLVTYYITHVNQDIQIIISPRDLYYRRKKIILIAITLILTCT